MQPGSIRRGAACPSALEDELGSPAFLPAPGPLVSDTQNAPLWRDAEAKGGTSNTTAFAVGRHK